MLIDAKSFETISKFSFALVKHADKACTLGVVRLDCSLSISLRIKEEWNPETYGRHGGLNTKTV